MNIDVCIPSDDCVRLISQFVEEMDLTAHAETAPTRPAAPRTKTDAHKTQQKTKQHKAVVESLKEKSL